MSLVSLVEQTVGPYLIGVLVSAVLWGVTCTQAWDFFIHQTKARRYEKALVTLLWACDSAQQSIIIYEVYHMCISNFGNRDILAQAPRTGVAQTALSLAVSTIAQGTYAHRIWKMMKPGPTRVWFMGSAIALYVVEFAAGMWNMYETAISPTWASLLAHERISVLVWDTVGAIMNSMLAFTLCYILLANRTDYASTNSIIQRVMVYTLGTGLLISLFDMFMFVMYFAAPHSVAIIAVVLILTRLHSCCYMVFLNSRSFMKHGFNKDSSQGIQLSLSSRGAQASTSGPTTLEVHVHQTKGDDMELM